MTPILIITAVVSGLVAGIFFAFSTFAMKGIRALPPVQGMQAMQAVNITAVQPPFMSLFFGGTVLSVVVAVMALVDLDRAGAWWALAGAVVYVFGVFVLTAAYHVPRNNRLAVVEPDDPDAPAIWQRYATEWTRANHIRAIAPTFTAVALILAALAG